MSKLSLLLIIIFLAGCAAGPEYRRPDTATPVEYRYAEGYEEIWQNGLPADELPKGEWWRIYHDPVLDELQQRAADNNQELRAALARMDQARAQAGISEAELMPRLDLQPSAQRSRNAEDLSPMGVSETTNTFRLPLDLNYELDIRGRLRRLSEADEAEFEASAAEVESFRLMLHSDVARTYFSLLTLDREIQLIEQTVALRRENKRMVTSRFQHGLSDKLDLSRADTELAVAEAEVVMLRQQRSEVEHSLALLLGEPASSFELPPTDADDLHVPTVDPGLPAELIQRRPDVAAAERQLMAANARIGAAEAAFFPAIRLTGAAGYGSNELSNLLNSGNHFWNFGPQLSLPIFDGGRNRARLEQAKAAHEEALARYQQTILQAMQEVENALAALAILTQQQETQQRALRHARETVDLSHQRYRAGLVSYLEVIESERAAHTQQRAVLQTRNQQLQANIALIKALGGGWDSDNLARPRRNMSRQ